MAARSTLPPGPGMRMTVAPRASSAAWRCGVGHGGVDRKGAGRAGRCWRPGASRRRLSTTTASGWRAVCARRTSSRGLSSSTVPMPVRTAPARARQAWPSARACFGGDPLAGAVVQGGLAVQGSRDLHAQPGRLAHHPAEEAEVEFARFGGAGADLDLDAGGAQPREALAGHQRVGVWQGGHDLADAGAGQGVAAGAGAAVVGAGLQRHIGGGAVTAWPRAAASRKAMISACGLAGLLGAALAQDRGRRARRSRSRPADWARTSRVSRGASVIAWSMWLGVHGKLSAGRRQPANAALYSPLSSRQEIRRASPGVRFVGKVSLRVVPMSVPKLVPPDMRMRLCTVPSCALTTDGRVDTQAQISSPTTPLVSATAPPVR